MLFDIRPVHISYIVDDREAGAWFLTQVLGLKAVRHEEFKLLPSSACPNRLDDHWCKTSYAYGPETTHFAIQQFYCYKGPKAIAYGNDFVGAKIKSLEAIARAKAIGIPGFDESEDTFVIHGPTGHAYRLIDRREHVDLDPIAEEIMGVTDMASTIHYWHDLLGAEIIDLRGDQFSLFFTNDSPRMTFKQSTDPLVMSPAHIGFTMPRTQLKEMSDHMMRSGTVVHMPFSRLAYDGKNSDYLVILRDPDGFYLYFHDVESFNSLSKFDPNAEARLSISILKGTKELNNRTSSWTTLNTNK